MRCLLVPQITCPREQQCIYIHANLSLALEDVMQLKVGGFRLGPADSWLSSGGSAIMTSVQLKRHSEGEIICKRLQQRHENSAAPQVVHWAVCQLATHRQQALRRPAVCTTVSHAMLSRAEAINALLVVVQYNLTWQPPRLAELQSQEHAAVVHDRTEGACCGAMLL